MNVLGIETSCDETAVAVVADGRRILSSVVSSQVELHAAYGGVVPELASRQHVQAMIPVLNEALAGASCRLEQIDAIAVTYGPGLAGALLVGLNFAKAMAFALPRPLVAVNHLEGHIYAAWLEREKEPQFPVLALIVSGGHSDIVLMEGHPPKADYDRLAATAEPTPLRLPRARLERPYDFSFSGLKTKVQRIARGEEGPPPPVAALAAAFQESVVDSLVTKVVQAARDHDAREIVLSGGVAANSLLRASLKERSPLPVIVPSPALCTDNGAMIAAAGWLRLQAGETAGLDLDVEPGLRIG